MVTAMFFGSIIVLLPKLGVHSHWLPSLWSTDTDMDHGTPPTRLAQPVKQSPHLVLSKIIHNANTLVQSPTPEALVVPVSGVSRGELHDSFGAPRSGGRRHEGIDIFAPRYTPVLSATPGLIIKEGTNRLGGKVVKILGPGGYIHYYAHLSSFGPKRSFERVQAGDLIGFVGNTGNARTTPSHLHYGIYQVLDRHLYHAIDPYPLLIATPAAAPEAKPLPMRLPRLPSLRFGLPANRN